MAALALGATPKLGGPGVTIVDLRGKLPTRGSQRYPVRDLSRVTGVDIHYTASPPTGTVTAIAQYQVGPGAQEAFPEIAYHYVVDGTGTPYWCHDLNKRVWGSGAPGHNEARVHVCYIGDREPNAAQFAGIRSCIVDAEDRLNRKLIVEGHKDAYATSCPGPTWPTWKAKVLP